MSRRLSFSIAVNLLTENFKKGANSVKNSLRSIQMQIVTFAAALGFGGMGLSGLLTRFKDVARETSRVTTALKNVSGGTKGFADNLRFLNDLAKKYGLEINALVGNYAKFTASATQANMPIEQQKKIFESVSRAITAFGLSASESDGVFLALSQMMGKGKISMEELRKQMGEKLPVAIQAMAKALGVSIGQMEKLIGTGKVMSADVLPKFADALNEIIPDVDTDNLETSLNRLSNVFGSIVDASGFQNKYKSLIDGLTSLLESASKNIQNIIIGIVAALGFVVANGLTKVYRGYAANGQQIIANATATHNKLRAAIAARVEAEKRLEELKLQHAKAVGRNQIALAAKIERAKQTLSARTAQINIAHENAKAAAAKAAALKSMGIWGTAWMAITGSAKKLMAGIRAMWNTFAPAIIISAIIALVGHFKNIYDEAKRVKNIFSDYKKELGGIKPGKEALQLEKLRDIATDINKSLKDRQSALDGVNKMLNTNFTIDSKSLRINGDINSQIEKRISLLKASAKAEYLTTKLVDMEAKRDELTQKRDRLIREDESPEAREYAFFRKSSFRVYLGNDIAGAIGMDTSKKAQEEINQLNKVILDANQELEKAVIAGGLNTENITTTTTPIGNTTDNKALRAAEKRLEALRKLDEEDRARQIEKQKFDLGMQQKAIDLLDDSFEKRTKQVILDLEKEKLAIEEFQNNMMKKQMEYTKDVFVSVKGDDKGFESYFESLKNNKFKDEKGIDVLPEGLRPQDIEGQVSELLSAAQAAQRKGLIEINKDLSFMLSEQKLMFKSDLEQKLAELDKYYDEQLKKAGNNAELIAQIEENRKRGKLEATTEDQLQKLDFSEQLENEKAAGLESIGMTELVEEKKLEITKKYIQLRIEALQAVADAGDEDAQRQIQIYQASLKKLDLQKPAKSLKGLADKAIFDRIKKGFEEAGDSADAAEEKTIKLLSSISNRAAAIGSAVSMLSSIFGGMNEDLDMAMETVGNIAAGFAGGIESGIMAVIGEGMKLFTKASEAAVRHQKALKEIEEARLASQRAYNLLLREQNLLLEEAKSIFGEKQILHAKNAMQNYWESVRDLKNEMQGDFAPNMGYLESLEKGASSGGIEGAIFSMYLNDYRKQIDNYNKGIGKLAKQQIVTGHEKTGLFGWGKGRDVYSSIIDEYDDIVDAEGRLNVARIQNILDTRQMSNETRNYLQNLINLQSAVEAAQEELKNYLQNTFGVLGDDIMSSLETAIREKGKNAWEEFGKAGAKVIEQLGRQLAYELFFADRFKKLQADLENIYGGNKSEEEIARESMNLIGSFYQGIGSQMELAQGFMENWQKEAEKHGLNLWQKEADTQDSTKGYSVSMDQDTGGGILGRLTGVHESILEVKSILGAAQIDSTKYLTQSIIIGDELKKHTAIFHEMQQMQIKSYRISESISESITSLMDIKEDISAINKNTKGLAPR